MKSLGAAVRISNGNPPASRIWRFTSTAMPSRWEKQLASSEEVLTTAIFGFAISASEMPSARHCARRAAHSAVPGFKLLRSGRFISQASKVSNDLLLKDRRHQEPEARTAVALISIKASLRIKPATSTPVAAG